MPISTTATGNDDTWSASTLFAVLDSEPPGGRSDVVIESRNQKGGVPTTLAVTRAALRTPMRPPGGVMNCSMIGGSQSTNATSTATPTHLVPARPTRIQPQTAATSSRPGPRY